MNSTSLEDSEDFYRSGNTRNSTKPFHIQAKKYRSVVKDGWLLKRGGSVKSWKRRYFLLTVNEILYYEKNPYQETQASSKNLKGTIPMSDIEYVTMYESSKGDAVKIITRGRDFLLVGSQKPETLDWGREIYFIRFPGDPLRKKFNPGISNQLEKLLEDRGLSMFPDVDRFVAISNPLLLDIS
eukprot:TRINITY_DN10630_c0_g1_i1.p1 TRINITY_DN10630_c0_g1~~TRINITY_DN10630_c0_g1_i1.p1  ORF type:complete len:183 (-),score=42.94 TRINITY_DN10630_c0_g1_i1:90-638(-)